MNYLHEQVDIAKPYVCEDCGETHWDVHTFLISFKENDDFYFILKLMVDIKEPNYEIQFN